ncbi:hypothetical protein F511_18718 [Dorcoceras hygrometricum]|uniref:Uncharacterized protein n=1 Tax=Dorcoceras hygrometricum TaxID=472368 RepID=A0A2Z7BUV5_9LAMI|nr:hypothetical protein F511_18718 [Dorcoceras hygrometricum]
MEELLERSPMLPRTNQTTASNDGNSLEKLMMNSNLGFEAKNTIGEIAKYGILVLEIEEQVFLKYISQNLVKFIHQHNQQAPTNHRLIEPHNGQQRREFTGKAHDEQ